MNQSSLDVPRSPTPPSGTLIHLGQPKTATTFLQDLLFHQHSQVTYLGKYSSSDTNFCSPEIARVARCLRQPTHPGFQRYHNKCQELLAQLRDPEKLMIFSDEAYTYANPQINQKQAELFSRFFGACRVLLTIREPLSLMESLYLQELRGYHYHKKIYKRLVKRFGAPPRYFSIEDWLEANWTFPNQGAFSHLRVADTAEVYARVFGKENIIIALYEDLKQDNLAFVRRLSQTIGIDADESERHCKNRDTKNARWKQAHVDRLKLFNHSRLLRWKYRFFKNVKDLRRFLGAMSSDKLDNSPSARAEYPTTWRDRILQIGSEQFARLKVAWDVPLERFGYPLPGSSTEVGSERTRNAA